ncbi:MAG: hypothetical protein ABI204_07640 [Ginsengibacter sp.]
MQSIFPSCSSLLRGKTSLELKEKPFQPRSHEEHEGLFLRNNFRKKVNCVLRTKAEAGLKRFSSLNH